MRFLIPKNDTFTNFFSILIQKTKKSIMRSINKEERKIQIYEKFKRFQDVVLSVLALIILLPVEIIIVFIVWIECPSVSPIYKQKRVGKDGKLFTLYKFRSMKPDADKELKRLQEMNEMDGPVFKIADDPRITKCGKFIRKTGLDELPQLINIIKGDMSIVGPRPPLPDEVKKYTKDQMVRLSVKQGLTCYWQIQHNRNQIHFEEWIELDKKYIKERGFLTDWKIILKTVNTIIHREGL